MATGEDTGSSINILYTAARDGGAAEERRLLEFLTVSFRHLAQLKMGNAGDAEEVVQDALITIAARYRDMEFEVSFAAWAYKVLRHKIMDCVAKARNRKRLMEQEYDRFEPEPTWQPDPQLREKILDCFRSISSRNRRHARILNLVYQGYTTAEICDRLHLSTGNFYVLLSRSRTALEYCLEKDKKK